MSLRPVRQILETTPTIEGAGVKLERAFGFGKTGEFDPFLLLDDFRNENPADYLAGFPWHPHRGIETITYVLAGEVAHGDSLGNKGRMTAGDVQWMTAGSGILHQEMPKGDANGRMHGFQLWANLPAALKMTAPRYQDIPSSAIPEVTEDDGTRARIICGEFWGKTGPVEGVAAGRVRVECRRALRRHLHPALQAQAHPGRDHAQRLRLRLRRLGNIPRRLRAARLSLPSQPSIRTRSPSTTRKTIRSFSSTAAMRSWSRPVPRASASCSSRASRWRSRSRGTAPS